MKHLMLLMVTAVAVGANAQGKFTINGNLQNAEGEKMYLYYGGFDNQKTDSVIVTGGKFCFKGEIDVPFMSGTLLLGNPRDYNNRKNWRVAIESQAITVNGDANNEKAVVIMGGKAQEELNRMTKEMSVFTDPMSELNKEYYAQQTQTGRDSISKLMEPYREQYVEYTKNYYNTHTDSYFSTYYLRMDMGHMKYEDVKAVWDKLSPEVQKYGESAKDVKDELDVLEKVRPGMPAPDFTANDINGKPFTLSSLKGKVVIIDFWASWCVPCRKSNPHMRELYNKYHSRGLDLVYVSDDDSKPEAWKKAVEKDMLVGDGYHHVLRGMKWDRSKGLAGIDHTNDISDKYAIHFLPTKYLIDRKGNIVCKIDEGEDAKLDESLERLLAE